MQYAGVELIDFESEKPQIFDPPRLMFVWNTEHFKVPSVQEIRCYDPMLERPFMEADYVGRWTHGAVIDDSLMPSIKNLLVNNNPYKDDDVRVQRNKLVCWDDNENKWNVILDNLPFSFGDVSVKVIYMTGTLIDGTKLVFTLLFYDSEHYIDGRASVFPVLVFLKDDNSLVYERYHTSTELNVRVGDWNYRRIIDLSRINWNINEIR